MPIILHFHNKRSFVDKKHTLYGKMTKTMIWAVGPFSNGLLICRIQAIANNTISIPINSFQSISIFFVFNMDRITIKRNGPPKKKIDINPSYFICFYYSLITHG